MNFDSRTEADFEGEKDTSAIAMYAGVCAYLQAVYDETESHVIATAFQEVWDKAMENVSPVEFYLKVSDAAKRLGY